MPKIRNVASGVETSTASLPRYDTETRCWECGNLRFSDWNGDLFQAIPDPAEPLTPRTVFSPVEFQSLLLTAPERIAIRAKRPTDPFINDLMTLIEQAGEVDLANPATRMGVGYLTTTTPPLLTPARASAVLSGTAVGLP
jgi:hypothetical protein